MTLTLEEVRNTKFHVARRQGYDTTEVDLFVDKVEAAFGQIVEENQMMRSQLEALSESQPEGDQGAGSDDAGQAGDQAREEARKQAESEYEKKLADLKNAHAAELKAAKDEAQKAREEVARARDEATRAKQDAEKAREDAAKTREDAAKAQQSGAAAGAAGGVAAGAAADKPRTDEQGRVVVTTAAEAGTWVQRAVEEANKIASDAEAEAKDTVEKAQRQAQQITDEAKGRAARLEQDARANAERITTEAQGRATDMDRELGEKRRSMMSQLETDRDTLNSAVSRLRAFEGRYRQNLAQHLRDQIASLESGKLEPEGGENGPSTPRLDALADHQASRN